MSLSHETSIRGSETGLTAPESVLSAGPSDDWVLRVLNVSKQYYLWRNPTARLVYPILQRLSSISPVAVKKRLHLHQQRIRGEFYALQEVSFELARGESLGIIGRNGSGKSTLLQMIAGTLLPTSGTVEVRGRVAALLELGSGFNPEFTGRENVFLNAAILGLTRRETEERFDRIAGFADIGGFIDLPVKKYSSGMLVRLAFAVAVHVEADVLIVDEALAVGDVFFQQKCHRKIREILDRGVNFLFVSHDYVAMKSLCKRAILLHKGRKVFEGPAEQCAHRYMREVYTSQDENDRLPGDTPTEGKRTETEVGPRAIKPEERSLLLNSNLLASAKGRSGDQSLEFMAASFTNAQGESIQQVAMCEQGRLKLLIRVNEDITEPEVAFRLIDRLANTVFSTCNHSLGISLGTFEAGDEMIVEFKIEFAVEPGFYTLTLETGKLSSDRPNMGVYFDVLEGLGPLQVYDPAPDQIRPFYGMARLPCEMTVT